MGIRESFKTLPVYLIWRLLGVVKGFKDTCCETVKGFFVLPLQRPSKKAAIGLHFQMFQRSLLEWPRSWYNLICTCCFLTHSFGLTTIFVILTWQVRLVWFFLAVAVWSELDFSLESWPFRPLPSRCCCCCRRRRVCTKRALQETALPFLAILAFSRAYGQFHAFRRKKENRITWIINFLS